MDWMGEIEFGEAWAAFRGQHSDNNAHSHAAIQVVTASKGEVTVVDSPEGAMLSAPSISIRSGVMHRLLPGERCTILLVEPQSTLGLRLQELMVDPIAASPAPIAECLSSGEPLGRVIAALHEQLTSSPVEVDRRLLKAVEWIASHASEVPVSAAASRCGLSPARLRALANEQLGVPLAKLVLWQKVKVASGALLKGLPPAEAAAAAGFADQAHLSRTVRQVLGVTPGTVRGMQR
jgi:AraC-like DNA-binding protein